MSRSISKEKVLDLISRSPGRLSFKDLAKELGLKGKEKNDLKRVLRELKKDKGLRKPRDRKYSVREEIDKSCITGHIDLTKQGYAFLIQDSPGKEDLYISEGNLNGAFHKDKVRATMVRKHHGDSSNEARVVDVIERGTRTLLGRFFIKNGAPCLYPLDERFDLVVKLEGKIDPLGLREGDTVAAALDWSSYSGRSIKARASSKFIMGRALKNFEDLADPRKDIDFVIMKNGVREEFPQDALDEAKGISLGDPAYKGRIDLTALRFLTVDPVDAKDFDDAVYLESQDAGWTLYVSIADVSFYVKDGSAMDREARQRGNSFYFPSFAVPMLPEGLSNSLCSLEEGKKKFTLTVKMQISPDLSIRKVDIFESTIISAARLDYDMVLDIINFKRAAAGRSLPDDTVKMILKMHELSEMFYEKRMKEGGIDFALSEPKYIFDGEGRIIDIARAERTPATGLIEEFMLLANRAVARFIDRRGLRQIYRVHEEPDLQRLKEFYERAAMLGYSRFARKINSSRELNDFLRSMKDEGRARTMRYLLLRSMKQACYSEVNTGHYGLGFDSYVHFTSPIRRYPDLVTHRIVKGILRGATLPGIDLSGIAHHSSIQERKAAECERDILRIKSARFMKDRIGEVFQGFISGKARGGFFVELKEHMVEGFSPLENVARPARSRKRFHGFKKEDYRQSIGDQVRVKVTRVSIENGLLEFAIL